MAATKKNTNTVNKGKATMYNVSRFDDDGYGIRNLKKPGDDKKKNTARKK